ncbi:MAG TPA: SDR family NAD(P)-dependent oxidoreductase [Amnibacterium sp.]|uniref:SDR family NAD(P)-dependent oxidoreductase n=1 Tax=Amnibacterium sp. TaxID=1872496 RepID=UPI002F929AC9
MSTDLTGRVALVTGATGGIGAALVDRLLEAGATIVGTTRDAAKAERDDRYSLIEADATDRASAARVVEEVERRHGAVDVLVPNAGSGTTRTLPDTTDEDWDEAIAVNLTAPFLLARAAVPRMADRRFGRVLFVSSLAAFTGGAIGPHYAASKAGLQGLVGFLASRYAASGVTVNAIAPALITGTTMGDALPDDAAAHIPVGRMGTTSEVAELAVAMLGNGYLTGKTMLLDGGLLAR